jgi:hypothetical protein
MAKTRSTTAPDANLISGAGFASKSYIGQPAQGSGASAVMQAAEGAQSDIDYRRQLRKQAETTMGNFIDNMPANIDIAKVPQSMRPQLNKYLVEAKNEYFENAKLASSNSPNSPVYMEAVDRMNEITQSFANLNNDFTKLKELKYQAIEDFDNGMISEGNRPEDIDFISKLTTDQVQFGIGPGGRLMYGEGATLDDVPKYHYKDHESATKVLNLSNTLYNDGRPLDAGREQIVRMQLQQQLKKGGRDAVLSMATDDHIIPGGLGIQDIDLLENPQRQEELEKFVVDSYMDVLRQSAQSGYQAKQAELNRSENRAINRSLRLAKEKKEKGLTSGTDKITSAQQREIDAADRVAVGKQYMDTILKGDTTPLIGSKYANQNVLASTFIGGSSASDLLSEYGYSNADIKNFEGQPGSLLLITDKDYFVVDPYNDASYKALEAAIIQSKFGADAVTDVAVARLEGTKPVLPGMSGPKATAQDEAINQDAGFPFLNGDLN